MQSSAFWEIIVFALIAFALVSKLIDILGEVDENDPLKSKSFFGESNNRNNIKKVGEQDFKAKSQFVNALIQKVKDSTEHYKDLIVDDNNNSKSEVIDQLRLIGSKIRNFNPARFLENAKKAFQITVDAIQNKDAEALSYLVDKRFLEEIQSNKYQSLNNNLSLISAKISEVYSFGNSIFIKVLFELTDDHKEEWVFIKNLLDSSPAWYISSINTITTYN